MAKRRVSHPLGLAVLATLSERSMHPYELVTILKDRGKEQSIRINYGSLYTVVAALVSAGFIEPVETLREGKRPERTVYTLTPAGQVELRDWLSSILCTPNKEFPEFEAGLSLLPVLPPDAVIELLRKRLELLEIRLTEVRIFMEQMRANGLRRLFLIEAEYEEALLRAELDWVREFTHTLEEGGHEDLDAWRRWHEGECLGQTFAMTEENVL